MQNNYANRKFVLVACLTVSLLLLLWYLLNRQQTFNKAQWTNLSENGWIISPALLKDMRDYVRSTRAQPTPSNRFQHNRDYIQFIRENAWTTYPFSSRTCVNTSNQDPSPGNDYCLLSNIYYQSAVDQYYFYRNPTDPDVTAEALHVENLAVKTKIKVVSSLAEINHLSVAAVLTRPIFVGDPIDPNYAHGFLEACAPRFWIIAELQSHGSFVDPDNIQIYYTSHLLNNERRNWEFYQRQPDGTYRETRKWSATLQAMFSNFPLLTYKSFNETTVMFKSLLITGNQITRSPVWDYYYTVARAFTFHPFHTRQYRRAYLAYSEWILKNLGLPSKFQLTEVQERLQRSYQLESFAMCEPECKPEWRNITRPAEKQFTGEWIVVVNRAGTGRREIDNADELVRALLHAFPDQTNPYLRVWPRQFNFNDDLHENARMARSIRLLIGVHGAGLANSIFMRPGAILYEINPRGCRKLSFNFRRWTTVFDLQHALWSPSQRGFTIRDDECLNRDAVSTVVTSEIVKEVINLIENERDYRDGYLRRALRLLNDSSLVDHPQLTLA